MSLPSYKLNAKLLFAPTPGESWGLSKGSRFETERGTFRAYPQLRSKNCRFVMFEPQLH
jgi:hypothetical protein